MQILKYVFGEAFAFAAVLYELSLHRLIYHIFSLTSYLQQAICTEAGMLGLRERRMKVNQADFKKAKVKALYKKKGDVPQGLYL